jgi:Domain of unknown function (DUF2017)
VAKGFRRTRKGITASLDEGERTLIDHLFAEVEELLGQGDGGDGASAGSGGVEAAGVVDPLEAMVGIGTATDEPSDPALARLLPSAHRDDDDISAEFRRYTEQGLRARKRTGLAVARATLARVSGRAEEPKSAEDARGAGDAKGAGDPKGAGDAKGAGETGAGESKGKGRGRAKAKRDGALLLTREEGQAWVVALTDVRLVLGERLGLRTDEDAEELALELRNLDEDDPRAFLAAIYDFLTWLQESLVQALMP